LGFDVISIVENMNKVVFELSIPENAYQVGIVFEKYLAQALSYLLFVPKDRIGGFPY